MMNPEYVNPDWWNVLIAFRKELNSRDAGTKDSTYFAQEYVRRRTGDAAYAGEFIGLFRTSGTFRVKSDSQPHRLCFATDVKSGVVFCWLQEDTNNEIFWTESVKYLLFEELKFAPKHLVCPEIEDIVKEQLPKLQNGEAMRQVIPAFLLAISAGTKMQPVEGEPLRDFEAQFENAVLKFAELYKRK